MKENLIEIRPGYFLNKNDPQYWRKRLNYLPDDSKAMYHVGMEIEKDAEEYLALYKESKNPKYLMQFQKIRREALGLYKKSFAKGCLVARSEILRLEEKTDLDGENTDKKSGFPHKKLLFCVLTGMVLAAGLFLALKNRVTYVTLIPQYSAVLKNNAVMVPYEVKKERPQVIPDTFFKEKIIETDNMDESKLIQILVSTVIEEYKMNGAGAIKVTAYLSPLNRNERKLEVGTAFWVGGNNLMQVFVYPHHNQLLESTTVIRSALYQYAVKNGILPSNLSELTQPYPENYLTALPLEPYSMKNRAVSQGDEQGGWIYSPQDISAGQNDSQLLNIISQSLQPNLYGNNTLSFSPLTLVIDKVKYTLSVQSGKTVFRKYPIGLGDDNSTPDGTYFVKRKIMNPDKEIPLDSNVFGTRGLELSNPNYAIHGTNDLQSIGSGKSHGCIRLSNRDMKDLYAMIPLNTAVIIAKNDDKDQGLAQLNLQNDSREYYNISDNSKEEDPQGNLHWKT